MMQCAYDSISARVLQSQRGISGSKATLICLALSGSFQQNVTQAPLSATSNCWQPPAAGSAPAQHKQTPKTVRTQQGAAAPAASRTPNPPALDPEPRGRAPRPSPASARCPPPSLTRAKPLEARPVPGPAGRPDRYTRRRLHATQARAYATMNELKVPSASFLAPLNQRLSPICTLSRYRLPLLTAALISWWRPPSSPSAARATLCHS